MIVQHRSKGRNQGAVILQRLTHAHHHHIGDDTVSGVELLAQGVLGKPQLRQNFAGGEVATKTLMTRRAKAAAHGTTGLG